MNFEKRRGWRSLDRGASRWRSVMTLQHGVDVVIGVSLADLLGSIEGSPRDWEYSAVRWVAVEEFAGFAKSVDLSPPSVAIGRVGWVG